MTSSSSDTTFTEEEEILYKRISELSKREPQAEDELSLFLDDYLGLLVKVSSSEHNNQVVNFTKAGLIIEALGKVYGTNVDKLYVALENLLETTRNKSSTLDNKENENEVKQNKEVSINSEVSKKRVRRKKFGVLPSLSKFCKIDNYVRLSRKNINEKNTPPKVTLQDSIPSFFVKNRGRTFILDTIFGNGGEKNLIRIRDWPLLNGFALVRDIFSDADFTVEPIPYTSSSSVTSKEVSKKYKKVKTNETVHNLQPNNTIPLVEPDDTVESLKFGEDNMENIALNSPPQEDEKELHKLVDMVTLESNLNFDANDNAESIFVKDPANPSEDVVEQKETEAEEPDNVEPDSQPPEPVTEAYSRIENSFDLPTPVTQRTKKRSHNDEPDQFIINTNTECQKKITTELKKHLGKKSTSEPEKVGTKVSEWHERVKRKLQIYKNRGPLNVNNMAEEIMKKFPSTAEQDKEPSLPFKNVVTGKPVRDVPRYFLACLQLANEGKVNIDKANQDAYSTESVGLTRLREERRNEPSASQNSLPSTSPSANYSNKLKTKSSTKRKMCFPLTESKKQRSEDTNKDSSPEPATRPKPVLSPEPKGSPQSQPDS